MQLCKCAVPITDNDNYHTVLLVFEGAVDAYTPGHKHDHFVVSH